MKYIEYPELSHLSRALTHDSSECTVHTRIEAYTTKSITREKRLWKNLEHTYAEEQAAANSPPDSFLSGDYPFGPGPLDKSARKTQYLLIATLNAAFPDHDFSELRPDHFCKETDGAGVLNALSTTLESLRDRPGNSIGGPAAAQPRSYSSYPPTSSDFFPSSVPTSSSPVSSFGAKQTPTIISGTHPTLYRMLDDIISLAECEVFSYVPDLESDPHAGAESDDEGSSSEEDSEDMDDDDDDTFGFGGVTESSWRGRWPPSRSRFQKGTLDDDESSPHSFTAPIPIPVRRRSRGGLLWSSHWFFHNKKQKRLLFISVWARNKSAVPQSIGWGAAADAERETFFGWEGAAGAGARAFASGMGLEE